MTDTITIKQSPADNVFLVTVPKTHFAAVFHPVLPPKDVPDQTPFYCVSIRDQYIDEKFDRFFPDRVQSPAKLFAFGSARQPAMSFSPFGAPVSEFIDAIAAQGIEIVAKEAGLDPDQFLVGVSLELAIWRTPWSGPFPGDRKPRFSTQLLGVKAPMSLLLDRMDELGVTRERILAMKL